MFGEQYSSVTSPFCNLLHSPVTSSLFGPKNFFRILFSKTVSLWCAGRVRNTYFWWKLWCLELIPCSIFRKPCEWSTAFEMWSHTLRKQFSSFGETDESIQIGGERQFSRLLAAEFCASAVVMQDTPCSEVVWRVLAAHSIHQFPLQFPTRVSPCANSFQVDSTALSITFSKLSWKIYINFTRKL